MRKASKAKIEAALVDWAAWRQQINARITGLSDKAARRAIRSWAAEVHQRIIAGELDFSTQALIRSTMRALEDLESGRYAGVTNNGGFICA